MHESSAPARQCIELAFSAAPAMIGRAVDEAVAALQQEEQRSPSVTQRQEIADAWLELTRRRAHWLQRFPALLRAAQLARPNEAAPHAAAASTDAGDRFGGLALVDEDALASEIENGRVLQLLAPKLEQLLAEFDALMSTALGLQVVQPERNPLRPQVFAQALRELMHPTPVPGWSKLWAQHLCGPLANEIANLYRDALKLLRAAHLTEASYRVLPPAPGKEFRQSGPAPLSGGPNSGHAPLSGGPNSGHAPLSGGNSGHAPLSANGPASGHAPLSGGHGGAGGSASTGTGPSTGPAPLGGSGGPGGGGGPGAAGGPGGAGGNGAPGLSTTGPLGGASWADLSGYALGDELFQNFLFSRTAPSTQALAPAYYAKVEAQLESGAADESFEPYEGELIAQLRELAPVERPARPIATTRELDNAAWGRWAGARERSLHRTRLKKEAKQVGQVLGLEVVRKLVDQVARDPRLLGPVREAIVAVEPALLRLALVSPRFFAQEDHAGRRLVERVAERSFRYNDEFGSEFQEFFADVRTTFRSLNERKVEDPTPFTQALQELEERWTGEDAVEQRGRQVAVDAVHFAEARAAEAAQIAWTLSQRSDLDGVPAVVQDFLFGPWSLVMAHARLTDPQKGVDPGGWTAVVPELLWSVKTEQTLRDPARLFTTLPTILERLREGLKLVGQEPAQNETFFNALEALHRPVLKLRARKRHASHGLDAPPPLDPKLLSTERQQPQPSAEPWITPQEWKAAGFDDSQVSAPAPLGAAGEESKAEVAAMVAGLHQGSWVDLHVRGKWRRANLTWVNERATLFMFVSHGGQPHTMTRRSLERLVRDEMLRPVEAGAVVPRAIDELSRTAPTPLAPSARGQAALEEGVAA